MTREKVLEVLRDMSQEIELDILFAKLDLIEKVEEGLREDDADETVSNEEVKRIIDALK